METMKRMLKSFLKPSERRSTATPQAYLEMSQSHPHWDSCTFEDHQLENSNCFALGYHGLDIRSVQNYSCTSMSKSCVLYSLGDLFSEYFWLVLFFEAAAIYYDYWIFCLYHKFSLETTRMKLSYEATELAGQSAGLNLYLSFIKSFHGKTWTKQIDLIPTS